MTGNNLYGWNTTAMTVNYQPWAWTAGTTVATNNTISDNWAFTSATYTWEIPAPATAEQQAAADQRYITIAIRDGIQLDARLIQLLTDEQRGQYQERMNAIARARAERDETLRAAEARAYDLLDRMLTPLQRIELAETGYITVPVPSGNRYRLRSKCRSGNIQVWDHQNNQWCCQLCVHIPGNFPDGDNLAAQILSLQTDEAHMLRTAYGTRGLPAEYQALREREVPLVDPAHLEDGPALNPVQRGYDRQARLYALVG